MVHGGSLVVAAGALACEQRGGQAGGPYQRRDEGAWPLGQPRLLHHAAEARVHTARGEGVHASALDGLPELGAGGRSAWAPRVRRPMFRVILRDRRLQLWKLHYWRLETSNLGEGEGESDVSVAGVSSTTLCSRVGCAALALEAKEALRRAAHELSHRVLVEAGQLPRRDHARRLRVRGAVVLVAEAGFPRSLGFP